MIVVLELRCWWIVKVFVCGLTCCASFGVVRVMKVLRLWEVCLLYCTEVWSWEVYSFCSILNSYFTCGWYGGEDKNSISLVVLLVPQQCLFDLLVVSINAISVVKLYCFSTWITWIRPWLCVELIVHCCLELIWCGPVVCEHVIGWSVGESVVKDCL